MSYDEAIQKLDTIILSLEQKEAISMEEYKQKAKEAKDLIAFCKQQLTAIEKEIETL